MRQTAATANASSPSWLHPPPITKSGKGAALWTLASHWQRFSHVKSILGGNSRVIIKPQSLNQYSKCRFEFKREMTSREPANSRRCRQRCTGKDHSAETCPAGDCTVSGISSMDSDFCITTGPILERLHHRRQRRYRLRLPREPLAVMCQRFTRNL